MYIELNMLREVDSGGSGAGGIEGGSVHKKCKSWEKGGLYIMRSSE